MQQAQQDSASQKFETVLLVVVESLLTVLLRFDSQLRQRVYPLVVADSLIAIRSYLPHDEIYLTFTFKGVLLDSQKPEHKDRPDVVINAHSFEIVNAIISDKDKAVEKLQFRGEAEQVAHFKAFLQELSLNGVVNNIASRFGKKQTNDADNKEANETEKPKTDYKAKLTELKTTHQQLEINNKKLATQVTELQSRQKFFSILAVITLIFGLLIGWLVF